MAQYVIRNGPEFEQMMRNKDDQRFLFLHQDNEYNAYYESKKEQFKAEFADEKGDNRGDGDDAAGTGKGVSFSIRIKDNGESSGTPVKTKLLNDSDNEDEQHVMKAASDKWNNSLKKSDSETSLSIKKQADESLKNKLALAARGKLVQAKEEDKLKAERKKRAAMFAALLKNNTDANSPAGSAVSLPAIASLASLTSYGGDDGQEDDEEEVESTVPAQQLSRGSSVNKASRSRSPSVAIVKETFARSYTRSKSRSRSRSPIERKRSRLKRSRSRERRHRRRRSRSRHRRRSRTRSPSPAPLPSAYSMIRRSASPSKRGRSPSPTSHRRSRHRRSRSKGRRSRSRHRRRSRSKSKSRSSKSKKRSRSKDKKHSKKRRSKPKMIPIPELETIETPEPTSNSPQSENTEENPTNGMKFTLGSENGSYHSSAVNTPSRTSDTDIKPSENILSKVRAMLALQREEEGD